MNCSTPAPVAARISASDPSRSTVSSVSPDRLDRIAFAVVIPVPALAVLFVTLLDLKGPVAAGIVLMSISPGAPVALRRAIDHVTTDRPTEALGV